MAPPSFLASTGVSFQLDVFRSNSPSSLQLSIFFFALRSQCPSRPPHRQRYFPVCVSSLNPEPGGRNKSSAAPLGFRPNNHKKYIHRSGIESENIRLASGPFHLAQRPRLLPGPASSFACTFVHSRPFRRCMFFSKRSFSSPISSTQCSGDNFFFGIFVVTSCYARITARRRRVKQLTTEAARSPSISAWSIANGINRRNRRYKSV